MICTRRTTVRIRPELRELDVSSLDRLDMDQLAELALQIEVETQLLNRLRRVVDRAVVERMEARRSGRPAPHRRPVGFGVARGSAKVESASDPL